MTITVKDKTSLVVPTSVQHLVGIESGERLEFVVSSGVITISPAKPATYKPTKSEMAAIRTGQTALARGESVSLTEFLDGLEPNRRKAGAQTNRKVPR